MYFLFKIDLNAINEYFEISGKMKKKKIKNMYLHNEQLSKVITFNIRWIVSCSVTVILNDFFRI